MQPYSIYLHIPFCRHRCSYCDFNTYEGLAELIPDYVHALCSEIRFAAASFGGPILQINELKHVIETLVREFEMMAGAEITLEANPEMITSDYLKGLQTLGINRLSLGMQSANLAELKLLERQHDYDMTAKTLHLARKAGFDNINLDLIFGIPHQTQESWQINLEAALSLNPEHLSLYALTVEDGTPLADRIYKGHLINPDPDLAADMYEWACERLDQSGYIQYEISNWARYDDAFGVLSCRHNLQYWRNLPYLGFGAGAHGFAGCQRTANILSPSGYIQCFQPVKDKSDKNQRLFPVSPASVDIQSVDQEQEMAETMMMGLRLTEEGISRDSFRVRFGLSLEEVYGAEIDELIADGLLEWAATNRDYLRLTPRGRLLGNQVFMRFI
jgi:oxygen-independent coproporphyrinogen-3 oxidase